MRIFLTIFPYAKFSLPFSGKKVGKGVQKFFSTALRRGTCHIHAVCTIVYAQTSRRDNRNHSRSPIKFVSFLKWVGVKGLEIYSFTWCSEVAILCCLMFWRYSYKYCIHHDWSLKTKLLFYTKALRFKTWFSLPLLHWSKQWDSRSYSCRSTNWSVVSPA